MRFRRFHAPTVGAAIERVRAELGADAIVVDTLDGGAGGATITAAIDGRYHDDTLDLDALEAAPLTAIKDTGNPTAAVAQALRFHGVPDATFARLMRALPQAGSGADALAHALEHVIAFAPLPIAKSTRIALVGPPGSGKTLMAAKLAARAVLAGSKPRVISTDGLRAGGLEQLAAFTRILGVEMKACANVADLEKAANHTHDRPILIDTPGTNPLVDDDLKRIDALISAARAVPVLVLAAGGDALEAAEAARAFARLGATRLCPTRLDLVRRYGALITAAEAAHLSIAEAGYAPFVGQGLTTLDARLLAGLLMPHEGLSPLPQTFPLAEAAQ